MGSYGVKAHRIRGRVGKGMGLAIAIFQMAIALGSICLVTKKPLLWYLSMGFALLATLMLIVSWHDVLHLVHPV